MIERCRDGSMNRIRLNDYSRLVSDIFWIRLEEGERSERVVGRVRRTSGIERREKKGFLDYFLEGEEGIKQEWNGNSSWKSCG